jgi:hypothetical protein
MGRPISGKKHATIENEQDSHYRDISQIMTAMGHKMNHTSCRNYVLRVMDKMADAVGAPRGASSTPEFQNLVHEMFEVIEHNRKKI